MYLESINDICFHAYIYFMYHYLGFAAELLTLGKTLIKNKHDIKFTAKFELDNFKPINFK